MGFRSDCGNAPKGRRKRCKALHFLVWSLLHYSTFVVRASGADRKGPIRRSNSSARSTRKGQAVTHGLAELRRAHEDLWHQHGIQGFTWIVSCLKASPSRDVGAVSSIRMTRLSAFLALHEGPRNWNDAAGCRGDTVLAQSALLLRYVGYRALGDASNWGIRAGDLEVDCEGEDAECPLGARLKCNWRRFPLV